jgi:hypothetical protein
MMLSVRKLRRQADMKLQAVLRCAWAICALALGLAAHAQEAAEALESDPPARVARLSLIEGEVSLAPAGSDEWAEAVLNRPLTSNDRLWVGADARAELQIGAASVHLDRESGFGFVQLDDQIIQMSLIDGAASVRVRRLGERETILIETPNVTVRLKHTGEYHFEVDPDKDRTIVKTRSGEADVLGGARTYTVRAGEQSEFTGLDQLSAQTHAIAARTPFEAWANDRERRAQRSIAARYVAPEVIGREDLDDYGDWVHEADYGYVWRPRYVVSGWAPYRHGRWAWISPWGWTWIDAAPWGFAPFHYGRWAYVRHRWCWIPGPRHFRPVYAPAMVGWIGGPSVGVSISFGGGVGWFPLGPREIYVPGYRHTPRYIRLVNASNTVIVNNTYITNVYGRRDHRFDYRHRLHPHAVTAVQREDFVSGRPVAARRVRLNDADLRQWRQGTRPPAIAPRRESVLAGQPREPRRVSGAARERDWLTHRGAPTRIGFDAERRAIERNGGRPISRGELARNPKERSALRGDVRTPRTAAYSGELKRPSQEHRREGRAPSAERGAAQPAPLTRAVRPSDARTEVMRGSSEGRTVRRSSTFSNHGDRPQAAPSQGDARGESRRAQDSGRDGPVARSLTPQSQRQDRPPATRSVPTAPRTGLNAERSIERRNTTVRERSHTGGYDEPARQRQAASGQAARQAAPPSQNRAAQRRASSDFRSAAPLREQRSAPRSRGNLRSAER